MTKEEIKEKYSMADIAVNYGFKPNRAGFITCPFHTGDRTASLKLYKDSFHCFGCGANGDIFTFVQWMENTTFKEAFLMLGGKYGKQTFEQRLYVYKAGKARRMREKEEKERQEELRLNQMLISIYRKYLALFTPMSDEWCDCYNHLQHQLYLHDILN